MTSEVEVPESTEAPKRSILADAACMAVIAATALLFFGYHFAYWPAILRTPDHWSQDAAEVFITDYFIHQGEFPQWNPFMFCGMPLAADPIAKLFEPTNLLRSLLVVSPTPLKTHVSMALMHWLFIVIAGWGAYFLAREFALVRGAAMAAATAFIFGGEFLFHGCSGGAVIGVLMWLPTMMLLCKRACAATGWRAVLRYGSMCGLLWGWSLLSGFPQGACYVGVGLGAFWFFHHVAEWLHASKLSETPLSPYGRAVVFMASVPVLGGLIAMAFVLPAAEFTAQSARHLNSGFDPGVVAEPNAPLQLLHYLVTFPGPRALGHEYRASGAGALLLSLLALLMVEREKRRHVVVFLATFLVLFDCSLGSPFPFAWLVARVSPFQMTLPSRAFMTAGLPLSMLVGFGADAAVRALRTRSERVKRSVLILAVGVPLMGLLWRWTSPHEWLPVTKVVTVAPIALALVLLALTWHPMPRAGGFVIAALICCEAFTWSLWFYPAMKTRIPMPASLPIDTLVTAPTMPFDNKRVADPNPNFELYHLRPAVTGYHPLFITRTRQVLCSPEKETSYEHYLMPEDAPRDNARGHEFLKRSFWLARQAVAGPLPDKRAYFPSATTVFLAEPAEAAPALMVNRETLGTHSVSPHSVRNPLPGAVPQSLANGRASSLPSVTVPPQQSALQIHYSVTSKGYLDIVFRDTNTGWTEPGFRTTLTPGGRAMAEIPLPDFAQCDITLTPHLDAPESAMTILAAAVMTDLDDENALIRTKRYGANSVELEVGPLPGQRILTFVDSYYPGWKAYVDGKAAKILLADDAFKAVVVPEGTHTVRFAFSSWRVNVGVGISLATVAGILAFWRIARPRV